MFKIISRPIDLFGIVSTIVLGLLLLNTDGFDTALYFILILEGVAMFLKHLLKIYKSCSSFIRYRHWILSKIEIKVSIIMILFVAGIFLIFLDGKRQILGFGLVIIISVAYMLIDIIAHLLFPLDED